MNTTAIIAEYNPFHNGHKFHLSSARKTSSSDYVFAVMSPSFVQRGECAIYDKWTRTRPRLNAEPIWSSSFLLFIPRPPPKISPGAPLK